MKTLIKQTVVGRALLVTAAMTLATRGTALERLEPPLGCYFGISLSPGQSISSVSASLGITPAVFVRFFAFPETLSDLNRVGEFLTEVANARGMAVLTFEPWQGLERIDEPICVAISDLCARYEQSGITGIFIRFGHEMNGNWYPWGQRPVLYKASFRLLAELVHARTSRTAMLWAPNYGVGYPFGTVIPKPGTPDFLELDTDHDGTISDRDDMYEPYYPGDDAVDWVGMTLYHWGINFPWLENEMPPSGSFARSITGTYQGTTPNFYERYCAGPGRQKPMAIPETSAFYNTQRPGPSEFAIKQAWWQQIFNLGANRLSPAIPLNFPKLKCIGWFDEYKQEAIAQNNWIDWRISANETIRTAFVEHLRKRLNGCPYFLGAQEAHCLLSQEGAEDPASCLGDCQPLDTLQVEVNGKTLVFSWNSRAGHSYEIQRSIDLKVWTPIGGRFPGTGLQIRTTIDSSAFPSPQAFFRLNIVGE